MSAPGSKDTWHWFDLGIKQDEADLADGDVVVVGVPMPFAGTVKEIWVGTNTLPTDGTVSFQKQATTDVALLDATLTLQTGLTAYVGAKQTLTTSLEARRFSAGNIISATWTLTDITDTDDAVFGALVGVEFD